jgi:hypothetical protein
MSSPRKAPATTLSIADGAQALDTFLATKALSLPSTETSAKVEPRLPPMKRSYSAQAPNRTKRGTPPPQGEKNREHNPPTSPARQSRRPHNDLLHIATVEGDPDKDSIPRPKPYTSLVPSTSPWNTHAWQMHDFGSQSYWGGHIPHPPFSIEIQMVTRDALATQ